VRLLRLVAAARHAIKVASRRPGRAASRLATTPRQLGPAARRVAESTRRLGQSTRRLGVAGGPVRRRLVLLAAFGAALSMAPAPVHTAPATLPFALGHSGTVMLDGPWIVAPDPQAEGTRLGWANGTFSGQAVQAPHVVNPRPVTGRAGSRNFAGSLAWFRTTVNAERAGTYVFRFESVNHRASVWVDGRLVGQHVGSYLPFEVRTDLGAGAHTVVVRADWRSPWAQSRAGWHRTWFNFGGLNRPVSMRRVGDSELLAPTLHTRLLRSGNEVTALVDVSVQVHNNRPTRELTVRGWLQRGDQRVELSFPARLVAQGDTEVVRTRVTVPSPALWAPGSPSLYELHLAVGKETAYGARVGLRQFTWSGGRLFLNGRHLRLRGASIQEEAPGRGDALTPADHDALVADLKAIGANATRSQHPLDVGLLSKFDAAGIIVWQGIGPVDSPGNWRAKTPALRAEARKRVRRTVRQAQLHPSIVAWSIANEVAGDGHPGGQAYFIDQMARWLHRKDPGRLVSVDVWGAHAPKSASTLLYRNLDAVGVTNYLGWYENTFAPHSVLAPAIRARVGGWARTFAGKVFLITEFGAEANSLNPSHRPGGYGFQARLLGLHLSQYRQIPRISGMLVWNLRDFALAPSFSGGSIHRQVPDIRLVKGINQKGVISYKRRFKPSVRVVRRHFGAFARKPLYTGR
jgi:hypothetical protein